MKKFISLSCGYLLLTLLFSFTAPNANGINNPGKRIQVLFNQNISFTELGLIQSDCDKKGIRLTFKKIEYNEVGKLHSLSFKVDCKDGFSGSASTEHLTKDLRFGFYRDYTENTKSPFGVGAIAAE